MSTSIIFTAYCIYDMTSIFSSKVKSVCRFIISIHCVTHIGFEFEIFHHWPLTNYATRYDDDD